MFVFLARLTLDGDKDWDKDREFRMWNSWNFSLSLVWHGNGLYSRYNNLLYSRNPHINTCPPQVQDWRENSLFSPYLGEWCREVKEFDNDYSTLMGVKVEKKFLFMICFLVLAKFEVGFSSKKGDWYVFEKENKNNLISLSFF